MRPKGAKGLDHDLAKHPHRITPKNTSPQLRIRRKGFPDDSSALGQRYEDCDEEVPGRDERYCLAALGASAYSNTPRPDLRPRRPALTYWINSGEGLNFSPNVRCRYSRMCRRVSRPTRSTNSNGPIGWLRPSFKALSISAA